VEREVRLAKARVEAYVRTSSDRVEVASKLADTATKERLRMTIKPPKISGTLRKSGAALLLAPDPLTAIPGAILLGASVVMKGRDPAGLEELAKQTQRTMRELMSIL